MEYIKYYLGWVEPVEVRISLLPADSYMFIVLYLKFYQYVDTVA